MVRPLILLVDDDDDHLIIAGEYLRGEGYEVRCTSDLSEAKLLLESEPISVAFLDIRFDDNDDRDKRGLTLALDTIATSSVPKVIMTKYGSADYAIESMRLGLGAQRGAVDFLHKQNGLPQMVTVIERLIQQARIFLSYAEPDRERTDDLYRRLQQSGFLPWLNRVDLRGGTDWERAVRHEMRQSDFIIVCLSKGSVGWSGFFQKEVGIALEILEEQPPGKIFVIPLRLEDCEIPHDRLRALMWVDLFQRGGYDKLVRAIKGGGRRTPAA